MFDRDEQASPERLDDDASEPIRCRFCDYALAAEAEVFGVGDRPAVATFFNPSGELMEVVTVRVAPGLRSVGPPTTEFSWFAGTAWTVGACGGCGVQIGWRWASTDGPESFAGLLTDRIRRP